VFSGVITKPIVIGFPGDPKDGIVGVDVGDKVGMSASSLSIDGLVVSMGVSVVGLGEHEVIIITSSTHIKTAFHILLD